MLVHPGDGARGCGHRTSKIRQGSHEGELLDLVDRAGDGKAPNDSGRSAHGHDGVGAEVVAHVLQKVLFKPRTYFCVYLGHTNIRGYGMDARWI